MSERCGAVSRRSWDILSVLGFTHDEAVSQSSAGRWCPRHTTYAVCLVPWAIRRRYEQSGCGTGVGGYLCAAQQSLWNGVLRQFVRQNGGQGRARHRRQTPGASPGNSLDRFKAAFAQADSAVPVGSTFSNAVAILGPPITSFTNDSGFVDAVFSYMPAALGQISIEWLTNGFTLLVSNNVIIRKDYSYTSSR